MNDLRRTFEENNEKKKQMNSENAKIYSQMVEYIRSNASDEVEGEKHISKIADRIIEAEESGHSAAELFGDDPQKYCQELINDDFPKRTSSEKIKFYIMIPWVALTWVFLLLALTSFLSDWTGGPSDIKNISLATLIIIGLGSILLVESLLRFLDKLGDGKVSVKGFNAKTIGIYLVIVVVILYVGFYLRTVLPVFTLTPLTSLILFIIGVLGQKFIFLRKK
ncbi:DUF1129 domain-containing protein [Paenibacillus sediminis]|uniref:Membrane-anchored protein n=1 Tax=Paenibacillus sediminis TaxID=664909 RepID=A0ABS4H576_9BACL|nr:DUF1129 family protein [Paenibacillus sediminis]MBP1937680.1 putative membrane-anchored protein [Paenibacillus sediminis]